jgi:hypothetical protein
MFLLENRINGILISCARVSRESEVGEGVFSYHVEYHRFGKESKIISFDITHRREENPEKLALLVYGEANKRLKGF